MQSFLSKVTAQLLSKNDDIANLTLVLPSKRAGLFLKSEFKRQIKACVILPRIVSIEEFINEISGLEILENTTLIFEFYKVYLNATPKESIEPFDVFAKWAHILLQDFNDLDSNLVDAEQVLNYLNDIKRIENWNLKKSPSDLVNNYLSFFENIRNYYSQLKDYLLQNNYGYHGLSYRTAFEKTDTYIKNHLLSNFIFIGFNALNKAEESIFKALLDNSIAEIYWDVDEFYLNNNMESGKFFKQYSKSWNYYINHDFNWISSNLNKKKEISIFGVPKNITQIKKTGEILEYLYTNEESLKRTAVVLGDENLLPVLLNSLPKELENANITMGYKLVNIPLADFFNLIFKLHLNSRKFEKNNGFYYKDFLKILEHPTLFKLWSTNKDFNAKIKELIHVNKTIFISNINIKNLFCDADGLDKILELLFFDWKDNIEDILQKFINLIDLLRNDEVSDQLEKEYFFRFNNVFKQLKNLNNDYGYIKDIKTLYLFFGQVLRMESLSFKGEPLKGLQIMGMLESRVLDFDNVILTSANEGFLPVGKTQNSFIPFDVKVEYGIPTYKDKDAIFAYHFYRLLQRAKKVYILYNTESDDFGSGEQSRFITQLEVAKEMNLLQNIDLKRWNVIPKLKLDSIPLKVIPKSDSTIERLIEIAKNGLSPSSLNSYIRNPLDFYKRKILGLKELEEVEETVAANTFGTIIHETLYDLYSPLIGKIMSIDDIKRMKKEANGIIKRQFEKYYSKQPSITGKNYLTLEIAKQFLVNFLNFELKELNKNKTIKILALEQSMKIDYSIEGLKFPIKLIGNIDRIDEVDGITRIIDYKTGKVESKDLNIKNWDDLIVNDKFAKCFQVLFYSFLYKENMGLNPDQLSFESGIISFKNLKLGFMKVNNSMINSIDMDNFLIKLDELILEIFNKRVPFQEKEIVQIKYG